MLTFDGWLDSGGKRQDAPEDGCFCSNLLRGEPSSAAAGPHEEMDLPMEEKERRNLRRFTDGKLDRDAELPSEVVVSLDTERVNVRFNSGLTLEHSRLRFCSLKVAAEVFRP